MSEKVIENNRVSVIGEIVSGFAFSHEVFGEGFYLVDVAVNRLSEQADIIPLMISERLLNIEEKKKYYQISLKEQSQIIKFLLRKV